MAGSARQRIMELIEELPDGLSAGEILAQVKFRLTVEERIRAADLGDTITHQEAMKELRKWRS